MELNTDGDLNSGGSTATSGGNGVTINTINFRGLQDGASIPAEFDLIEGAVTISDGYLKGDNGDTASFLLLDSEADGVFTTIVGGGGNGTFQFSGVVFRATDLANYHKLMWQNNNDGLVRYVTSLDGTTTKLGEYTSNFGGSTQVVGLMVICAGDQIIFKIANYASLTDINNVDDPAWDTLDTVKNAYNQTAIKSGLRVGNEWHEIPEYSYTTTTEGGGGGEEVNEPPTAITDGNKTGIVAGSQATINMIGSTAVSPATIANYSVTQVGGNTTVALSDNGNSWGYTAPSETYNQDLVFQVIVTDSVGESSEPVTVTHSVLAYVETPNIPPTANAGSNLPTIAAGAQFQLNGSGVANEPGAAILGYRWEQISTGTPVALSNALIENPTGTAPISSNPQTLTYELTVTDTNGLTATDTVNVPIAAEVDTTPPVITLQGGNVVLNVGETFQEPGFKVYSNKGIDITSTVTVVVTGSTETAFPRVGELEYNVVVDGIAAETKTRLFTVIEVSELLEEVSKQKFVLEDNKMLHAFAGRANLEKVRFKLASTNTNIALDKTGCYDFNENETQKVEVITPSGLISSESGDVEWEGGDLYIRTGAFSSMKTHESARVVVYLANDDRGVVFAGPGLPANLMIHFN